MICCLDCTQLLVIPCQSRYHINAQLCPTQQSAAHYAAANHNAPTGRAHFPFVHLVSPHLRKYQHSSQAAISISIESLARLLSTQLRNTSHLISPQLSPPAARVGSPSYAIAAAAAATSACNNRSVTWASPVLDSESACSGVSLFPSSSSPSPLPLLGRLPCAPPLSCVVRYVRFRDRS